MNNSPGSDLWLSWPFSHENLPPPPLTAVFKPFLGTVLKVNNIRKMNAEGRSWILRSLFDKVLRSFYTQAHLDP